MGTLRLLLAVSVVFAHLGMSAQVLVGGMVAVQAFFLISGFLISYVLVNTPAYSSAAVFLTNRALRLFPAYWVIALCTLAWIAVSRGAEFWSGFDALPGYAQALLAASNVLIVGQDAVMFLAVTNGELVPVGPAMDADTGLWRYLVVPQAWTLSLELAFNVIAPFVLRRRPLLLWLLAASIAARCIGLYLGYGLKDPWNYRFFPFELAWFLIGALAHQIGLEPARRVDRANPLLKWWLVALLAVAALSFPYWPLAQGSAATAFKALVFLSLVVVALPFLFLAQARSTVDRRLGDYSYPVYIAHWLAIMVASDVTATGPGEPDQGAGMILALLVTACLSHILVRWIDPAVGRLRDKVRAGQARGMRVASTAMVGRP